MKKPSESLSRFILAFVASIFLCASAAFALVCDPPTNREVLKARLLLVENDQEFNAVFAPSKSQAIIGLKIYKRDPKTGEILTRYNEATGKQEPVFEAITLLGDSNSPALTRFKDSSGRWVIAFTPLEGGPPRTISTNDVRAIVAKKVVTRTAAQARQDMLALLGAREEKIAVAPKPAAPKGAKKVAAATPPKPAQPETPRIIRQTVSDVLAREPAGLPPLEARAPPEVEGVKSRDLVPLSLKDLFEGKEWYDRIWSKKAIQGSFHADLEQRGAIYYRSQSGKLYALGPVVGAGAQAIVFRLRDDSKQVIKIFSNHPDDNALLEKNTTDLAEQSGVPVAKVFAESADFAVKPYIKGESVDDLKRDQGGQLTYAQKVRLAEVMNSLIERGVYLLDFINSDNFRWQGDKHNGRWVLLDAGSVSETGGLQRGETPILGHTDPLIPKSLRGDPLSGDRLKSYAMARMLSTGMADLSFNFEARLGWGFSAREFMDLVGEVRVVKGQSSLPVLKPQDVEAPEVARVLRERFIPLSFETFSRSWASMTVEEQKLVATFPILHRENGEILITDFIKGKGRIQLRTQQINPEDPQAGMMSGRRFVMDDNGDISYSYKEGGNDRHVALGRFLGFGKDGLVFQLKDRPGFVVKIYFDKAVEVKVPKAESRRAKALAAILGEQRVVTTEELDKAGHFAIKREVKGEESLEKRSQAALTATEKTELAELVNKLLENDFAVADFFMRGNVVKERGGRWTIVDTGRVFSFEQLVETGRLPETLVSPEQKKAYVLAMMLTGPYLKTGARNVTDFYNMRAKEFVDLVNKARRSQGQKPLEIFDEQGAIDSELLAQVLKIKQGIFTPEQQQARLQAMRSTLEGKRGATRERDFLRVGAEFRDAETENYFRVASLDKKTGEVTLVMVGDVEATPLTGSRRGFINDIEQGRFVAEAYEEAVPTVPAVRSLEEGVGVFLEDSGVRVGEARPKKPRDPHSLGYFSAGHRSLAEVLSLSASERKRSIPLGLRIGTKEDVEKDIGPGETFYVVRINDDGSLEVVNRPPRGDAERKTIRESEFELYETRMSAVDRLSERGVRVLPSDAPLLHRSSFKKHLDRIAAKGENFIAYFMRDDLGNEYLIYNPARVKEDDDLSLVVFHERAHKAQMMAEARKSTPSDDPIDQRIAERVRARREEIAGHLGDERTARELDLEINANARMLRRLKEREGGVLRERFGLDEAGVEAILRRDVKRAYGEEAEMEYDQEAKTIFVVVGGRKFDTRGIRSPVELEAKEIAAVKATAEGRAAKMTALFQKIGNVDELKLVYDDLDGLVREVNKSSFLYAHGSNSGSLLAFRNGDQGGLEATGGLLEKGEAPFGGELDLAFFIRSGKRHVNWTNLSAVPTRSDAAVGYAKADFESGFSLDIATKQLASLEATLKETEAKVSANPGDEEAKKTLDGLKLATQILQNRIKIYGELSATEREFVEKPFPILYHINPKEKPEGRRLFGVRSSIPEEVGIAGRVPIDEITTIYTDRAHIETVKRYLALKFPERQIRVRSLEALETFYKIAGTVEDEKMTDAETKYQLAAFLGYAEPQAEGRLAVALDYARKRAAEAVLFMEDTEVKSKARAGEIATTPKARVRRIAELPEEVAARPTRQEELEGLKREFEKSRQEREALAREVAKAEEGLKRAEELDRIPRERKRAQGGSDVNRLRLVLARRALEGAWQRWTAADLRVKELEGRIVDLTPLGEAELRAVSEVAEELARPTLAELERKAAAKRAPRRILALVRESSQRAGEAILTHQESGRTFHYDDALIAKDGTLYTVIGFENGKLRVVNEAELKEAEMDPSQVEFLMRQSGAPVLRDQAGRSFAVDDTVKSNREDLRGQVLLVADARNGRLIVYTDRRVRPIRRIEIDPSEVMDHVVGGATIRSPYKRAGERIAGERRRATEVLPGFESPGTRVVPAPTRIVPAPTVKMPAPKGAVDLGVTRPDIGVTRSESPSPLAQTRGAVPILRPSGGETAPEMISGASTPTRQSSALLFESNASRLALDIGPEFESSVPRLMDVGGGPHSEVPAAAEKVVREETFRRQIKKIQEEGLLPFVQRDERGRIIPAADLERGPWVVFDGRGRPIRVDNYEDYRNILKLLGQQEQAVALGFKPRTAGEASTPPAATRASSATKAVTPPTLPPRISASLTEAEVTGYGTAREVRGLFTVATRQGVDARERASARERLRSELKRPTADVAGARERETSAVSGEDKLVIAFARHQGLQKADSPLIKDYESSVGNRINEAKMAAFEAESTLQRVSDALMFAIPKIANEMRETVRLWMGLEGNNPLSTEQAASVLSGYRLLTATGDLDEAAVMRFLTDDARLDAEDAERVIGLLREKGISQEELAVIVAYTRGFQVETVNYIAMAMKLGLRLEPAEVKAYEDILSRTGLGIKSSEEDLAAAVRKFENTKGREGISTQEKGLIDKAKADLREQALLFNLVKKGIIDATGKIDDGRLRAELSFIKRFGGLKPGDEAAFSLENVRGKLQGIRDRAAKIQEAFDQAYAATRTLAAGDPELLKEIDNAVVLGKIAIICGCP